MDYANQISTTIPEEDIKEILHAIDFINSKIPDLVTLSKEELDALPKMADHTIDFVLENLNEAEANPEAIPENVDIEEVKKDVELIKAIYKILGPVKELEKRLEDGALLAGSEAYLPCISIYNAIKAEGIRKRHHREKVKS